MVTTFRPGEGGYRRLDEESLKAEEEKRQESIKKISPVPFNNVSPSKARGGGASKKDVSQTLNTLGFGGSEQVETPSTEAPARDAFDKLFTK
ncbi:MAG TPA: hypothetical protein VEA59_05820 [Patescibacteria group bacterium]|nr:hypothetical protein [Patescibacteria group bacterium]